jgi:hypothetical protein
MLGRHDYRSTKQMVKKTPYDRWNDSPDKEPVRIYSNFTGKSPVSVAGYFVPSDYAQFNYNYGVGVHFCFSVPLLL